VGTNLVSSLIVLYTVSHINRNNKSLFTPAVKNNLVSSLIVLYTVLHINRNNKRFFTPAVKNNLVSSLIVLYTVSHTNRNNKSLFTPAVKNKFKRLKRNVSQLILSLTNVRVNKYLDCMHNILIFKELRLIYHK